MSNIININLIELDLKSTNKKDAIRELAVLIDNEKRLNNCEDYIQDVLSRENLTTTGIGYGIAIPHGKSNAVKVPTVAVGRVSEGIDWDSLDGKVVNIIFQLAIPEQSSSDQHLKILAALSRKLMNEEFVYELFNTPNKEGLLYLLSNVFEKVV